MDEINNPELNEENNGMQGEEYNEELEDNVVVLKDEEGNDQSFEFLDLIEYDGNNYIILLPIYDDEEESDEVLILKEDGLTEDGQNEGYVSVEDENILNDVYNIFKDKFKDEFDFQD